MPKLLLVEDDPSVADMLETVLESAGYTVTTLGNGTQVRATVEVIQPDVIVLDLMMPEQDGVTALSDLSTLTRRPPVLVVSAYLPQVQGEQLVAPWGAAFLAKPMDLYAADGLLARVAALLGGAG